jgi:uncharacterized protein (TIGR02594 family)
MSIAEGEIGVKEGNNPRITEYFKTTTLGAQPDSVPWCSAFVNFCVTQSDNKGTDSALARSWLNWGVESDDLVPGCIMVIERGSPPKGHVGYFVGRDANGTIQLLGGNQSNAVNISSFPNARALGKRILPAANVAGSTGASGALTGNTGPGMSEPSPSASIDELAKHAFDFFVKSGWSREQAAGLVANIEAESSFRAHGPAGDGGRARGLCQWHPDRQAKFSLCFPGRTFDSSTFGEQLKLVNFELLDPHGGENRAARHLKAARTAQEAGEVVSIHYERPRDREGQAAHRGQLAIKWFNKFT